MNHVDIELVLKEIVLSIETKRLEIKILQNNRGKGERGKDLTSTCPLKVLCVSRRVIKNFTLN